MRRESYSNRFATALDGVDLDNPGTALDRSGHPNPVPRVVGQDRAQAPGRRCATSSSSSANTDRAIKMTVPGPVHDVPAGAERLLRDDARARRSTTPPRSTPRSATCSRPAPTSCRSTSPTCRRAPRRRASTAVEALDARARRRHRHDRRAHLLRLRGDHPRAARPATRSCPSWPAARLRPDLDRDRAVEPRRLGARGAAGQDDHPRRARPRRPRRSRRRRRSPTGSARALPYKARRASSSPRPTAG